MFVEGGGVERMAFGIRADFAGEEGAAEGSGVGAGGVDGGQALFADLFEVRFGERGLLQDFDGEAEGGEEVLVFGFDGGADAVDSRR